MTTRDRFSQGLEAKRALERPTSTRSLVSFRAMMVDPEAFDRLMLKVEANETDLRALRHDVAVKDRVIHGLQADVDELQRKVFLDGLWAKDGENVWKFRKVRVRLDLPSSSSSAR